MSQRSTRLLVGILICLVVVPVLLVFAAGFASAVGKYKDRAAESADARP